VSDDEDSGYVEPAWLWWLKVFAVVLVVGVGVAECTGVL
jgi:hypothetical protein